MAVRPETNGILLANVSCCAITYVSVVIATFGITSLVTQSDPLAAPGASALALPIALGIGAIIYAVIAFRMLSCGIIKTGASLILAGIAWLSTVVVLLLALLISPGHPAQPFMQTVIFAGSPYSLLLFLSAFLSALAMSWLLFVDNKNRMRKG